MPSASTTLWATRLTTSTERYSPSTMTVIPLLAKSPWLRIPELPSELTKAFLPARTGPTVMTSFAMVDLVNLDGDRGGSGVLRAVTGERDGVGSGVFGGEAVIDLAVAPGGSHAVSIGTGSKRNLLPLASAKLTSFSRRCT